MALGTVKQRLKPSLLDGIKRWNHAQQIDMAHAHMLRRSLVEKWDRTVAQRYTAMHGQILSLVQAIASLSIGRIAAHL